MSGGLDWNDPPPHTHTSPLQAPCTSVSLRSRLPRPLGDGCGAAGSRAKACPAWKRLPCQGRGSCRSGRQWSAAVTMEASKLPNKESSS